MPVKKMSFVAACRNHFGAMPGQSLKEFGEELKALTQKDRNDLAEMFPSVGIIVDPESIKIPAPLPIHVSA